MRAPRTSVMLDASVVKWMKVYAALTGETVSGLVEREIAKADWQKLAKEAFEKQGAGEDE